MVSVERPAEKEQVPRTVRILRVTSGDSERYDPFDDRPSGHPGVSLAAALR
jgi:hypothetical protein